MSEAARQNWPDISGRLVGGVHTLPVRVYYEDTDFSGVVYHANYLKFCERGRSDFLRLRGIHHHEMLGVGAFAVRRMVSDFLKPARIDDLLTVESYCREAKGARVEISQRILRGEELLYSAEVTAVFIDPQGRPKRLPAQVQAAMVA